VSGPPSPGPVPQREKVESFTPLGVEAFTTTRAAGDYGLGEGEPPPDAVGRWMALREELAERATMLASARQVHGTTILDHAVGAPGWVRHDGADGHLTFVAGVACAVTVADCVPVFIAHPSGAVALLHAGWRGTAARIVEKAIARMIDRGLDAGDLAVHLGPAICGRCYEVGPAVFEQLTGWQTIRNRHVDLRALIAE
jgi:copper oxidase (laccase) domain-containing protein